MREENHKNAMRGYRTREKKLEEEGKRGACGLFKVCGSHVMFTCIYCQATIAMFLSLMVDYRLYPRPLPRNAMSENVLDYGKDEKILPSGSAVCLENNGATYISRR